METCKQVFNFVRTHLFSKTRQSPRKFLLRARSDLERDPSLFSLSRTKLFHAAIRNATRDIAGKSRNCGKLKVQSAEK